MLLFHSLTHSHKLWVCKYTRSESAVNSNFSKGKIGNVCCLGESVAETRLQIMSSRKQHKRRDLGGGGREEKENGQVKRLFQVVRKWRRDPAAPANPAGTPLQAQSSVAP